MYRRSALELRKEVSRSHALYIGTEVYLLPGRQGEGRCLKAGTAGIAGIAVDGVIYNLPHQKMAIAVFGWRRNGNIDKLNSPLFFLASWVTNICN